VQFFYFSLVYTTGWGFVQYVVRTKNHGTALTPTLSHKGRGALHGIGMKKRYRWW